MISPHLFAGIEYPTVCTWLPCGSGNSIRGFIPDCCRYIYIVV